MIFQFITFSVIKGFPDAMTSWQLELKNTTKSHHATNLTQEIRKDTGGWLPVLGRESEKNWAGGKLDLGFLREHGAFQGGL